MSIFNNIETAPAPNQGRYFQDGTYVCELHRFTTGTSRKDGTPYVAVEATVKTVLNGYDESNQIGERVSWVIMRRQEETFLSSIKGFVAAAAQCPYEAVSAELCDKLSDGDGSEVAGIEVVADANTITTRKGSPFMKVVWRSVE